MLNNHIADFIKKKFNVEINDFIMNDKYFYDCLNIKYPKELYFNSYKFIPSDEFIILYYLFYLNKKKKNLSILDLGSGWGKWSILNSKISSIFNNVNYKFTNVEALKKRENQLKKVLKLNKFEKQNIININQPIDISAKKVNFYNGKTHEWFGQSITINDHKINKIKNFFNRILNKNNILYNLNTIALENVISNDTIDLCIIDIQGLELDLIDKNIDLIKSKIKYLIIGTHNKNTEMSKNKDNHPLLLNLINKINFDIQFECEEKKIKNFYEINITCAEDGIIVAKNKEFNDL
jgi:FkbM family methyltransferase